MFHTLKTHIKPRRVFMLAVGVTAWMIWYFYGMRAVVTPDVQAGIHRMDSIGQGQLYDDLKKIEADVNSGKIDYAEGKRRTKARIEKFEDDQAGGGTLRFGPPQSTPTPQPPPPAPVPAPAPQPSGPRISGMPNVGCGNPIVGNHSGFSITVVNNTSERIEIYEPLEGGGNGFVDFVDSRMQRPFNTTQGHTLLVHSGGRCIGGFRASNPTTVSVNN